MINISNQLKVFFKEDNFNMNISSTYSASLTKRIFASGAIGNILETYDLILISLMATILSIVFFPPSSVPYAHVIDILYVFLVSLLMRPVGNIIMALFADQIGRKKLMVITLTSTGICSAIIGLLPSYQYIGVWSTTLFILIRILMNLFAGIEYVNSATYLIESSDKKTRGFFGSWSAIGISGGYLLASIISLLVSYLISINILPEWSWRFVFIFSLIGMAFGTWLRYSIPESIEFMMNNAHSEPKRKTIILRNSLNFIKCHPRQCISLAALTVMGTCLSFIYYIYIPLTLITTRNFTQFTVLSINVISLTLVIALIPLFGKLSDYFNTIKLLKFVCSIVSILALPFFWVTSYGTYYEILFLTLLISIPSSCFFSIYPTILIERFPSNIRCTTSSLIYQIVFSATLGTLPLMVSYLIHITKYAFTPAYLLIFSCLIGYIGLVILRKIDIENNYSIPRAFTYA
jgi:MFS transporter, MHS family, proline/betaine transporter